MSADYHDTYFYNMPRNFSAPPPPNEQISSFGGIEVACWPLVPKFAGSNSGKAVGVSGRKNPQHAFLRK